MDSMLTGKNYTRDYSYTYRGKTYNITSKGSARQYFENASFGQYNPQLDVVGPVTVKNNMKYYGGNNSSGSDKYPETMIQEACQLVDDSVDFSLYDNDEDGYVDFVYVIYAGYGEADGGGDNTIWPHAWYLYSAAGKRCEVDGKVVDLYACGNEMDNYTEHHTGIGTFCHEFSHVLGLPDLYETTGYGTHKTFGEWSILDYGPYNNEGNTPPMYSAYERFFMGWLTPELIVDSANIVLEELNSSQHALLISETDQHNLIGNDPNPTKFYLLENRQQEGWDEYLPGHGLMLTYVQYNQKKWAENTVNNTEKSMGVDLIEADGKAPD
jgi:M6 family metalloprotease-like protein